MFLKRNIDFWVVLYDFFLAIIYRDGDGDVLMYIQ